MKQTLRIPSETAREDRQRSLPVFSCYADLFVNGHFKPRHENSLEQFERAVPDDQHDGIVDRIAVGIE